MAVQLNPGRRRRAGGCPMTRPVDRDSIVLAKGSHDDDCDNPDRCLFEWYNWLAAGEHTDGCPPDVSLVLHAFGTRLNDALPDDRRQVLKRYLPNGVSPLAGTRGDGLDEARGYLALDWLIRTFTPPWLDLAGLNAEATALRDLRRIVDLVTAQAARPVVRDGRDKAYAKRAAAEDVAGDAAWAAAQDAAWDGRAAWTAAWAAAQDAAWDGRAAWTAAGAAAWDAAWDAARAAAGHAAGDAAWAAAQDAAWAAAQDAAWAAGAAGDALQPTVDQLQDSAIDLYGRMIRPEATS